jgi:hypothetical protein
MEQIYRHRQSGTLTLAGLGTGALVLIVLAGTVPLANPQRVIVSVVAVLLALAVLLFGSLTVSVSYEQIDVRFGPGLIRKRFRSAEVLQVKPVRNHWYYGWGIRLTPRGWLFNVSGLDAVELLMRDGRTYRIGTDQPKELAAAISSARKGR